MLQVLLKAPGTSVGMLKFAKVWQILRYDGKFSSKSPMCNNHFFLQMKSFSGIWLHSYLFSFIGWQVFLANTILMIRQCSWPIFSFYDHCEVHGTTQKTFINACLVVVHTKAAERLNKPQCVAHRQNSRRV